MTHPATTPLPNALESGAMAAWSFPAADEPACPLGISVRDVSLAYPGGARALDGVNFVVAPGERVAIVGPSGAGKSSLVSCLAGETKQSTGCVKLSDNCWNELSKDAKRRLKSRVGRVYQDFRLVPTYSALKNVLLGKLGQVSTIRSLFGFAQCDREKARCLLADLGLCECEHVAAKRLSGGEKQRLAIARALMQNPGLLLADEPVASLDARLREQIVERLVEINKTRGLTVLGVFHDLELAEAFAPRALVLNAGRLVYDGPSANLRATMDRVLAWTPSLSATSPSTSQTAAA